MFWVVQCNLHIGFYNCSNDMLNLDYMYLAPHKDENFRLEPFIKPVNQNIKLAKIYWMGAMIHTNGRRQGLMSGITA